jgi:hypothetical protein
VVVAQEVKFIDLSVVRQRRYYLAYTRAEEQAGIAGRCVGGGSGGGSVGDGAPDPRDLHALGVYLLGINQNIDPRKPFNVEFRVLNTGLQPMELPIWPHLADLQPKDSSVAFSYLSLALAIRAGGLQRDTLSIGYVELYGADNHEGTTLILNPGEWISVKANVSIRNWPESTVTRLQGEFWLRDNTFRPHPGGWFTNSENLYLNITSTPPIDVRLLRPPAAQH